MTLYGIPIERFTAEELQAFRNGDLAPVYAAYCRLRDEIVQKAHAAI